MTTTVPHRKRKTMPAIRVRKPSLHTSTSSTSTPSKRLQEVDSSYCFLQFCAHCEIQIPTPNASILYCSSRCRRADGDEGYVYSPTEDVRPSHTRTNTGGSTSSSSSTGSSEWDRTTGWSSYSTHAAYGGGFGRERPLPMRHGNAGWAGSPRSVELVTPYLYRDDGKDAGWR